jgi:serine protease inhibitor
MSSSRMISAARKGTAVACLGFAGLCAACSLLGDGDNGPPPLLTRLPRNLSAPETLVINAENQLGFDLLGRASAAEADGNLLISPLSAAMSLGMTLNGAAGTTLDSMRTTLGLGDASLADINAAYRGLLDLLGSLDQQTDFRIANSVWTESGFPVLASFLDAVGTNFDAEAQSLDLQAPTAPGTINDWVNRKTAGKIPTIVDQVSPDEVMFLINAIYFKGQWRVAFDPQRTHLAPFHAPGETQSVAMMDLRPELHGHAITADAEVLELLYGNGAYAMTIILPAPGHSVAALAAGMNAEQFAGWVAALRDEEFGLTMPKFRFEYRRELKDDLSALGMRIAFDGDAADFSRLADPATGGRLFLTRVTQKTFIDVNEAGTEAAAVTSTGVGVTSAPPHVDVDRPFLFVLRERLSGTIFFIGQVNRIP